jgi:cytochrome P450/NADPH-cytochrome P450 reductase
MVRETRAGFRLPDDPLKPIVMIGPGTGLAPFRGFLQERASLAADGRMLGPAKLFFGCRRSDQDFLYADELKDYEARGLVALHVAFSRANGAKTYVQHLLEEQRDSVWRMIEDGAIVYVCGDGGRMEPGVKATLIGVYREKSGASEEDAQRWIDNMGTQNRYVLDVWTGG